MHHHVKIYGGRVRKTINHRVQTHNHLPGHHLHKHEHHIHEHHIHNHHDTNLSKLKSLTIKRVQHNKKKSYLAF